MDTFCISVQENNKKGKCYEENASHDPRKLVGAVTHVLIDDPAAGYRIFSGNMLNAAA